MMFCNCHNGALTVLACLLSLSASLIVFALVFHAVIAQATSEICSNYNDTSVPLLIDIASSQGGCGDQGVVAALDATAQKYFDFACNSTSQSSSASSSSDGSLFAGLKELCASGLFACPPGVAALTCQTSFDWPNAAAGVSSILSKTTTRITAGCLNCNISTCATQCSNLTAKALAQSFSHFAQLYSGDMEVVFTVLYPDYVNCTGLYNAIEWGSPLQDILCNSFNTDFTNISIQFLSMSLLSIPLIVIIILGAKRFQKMKTDSGEDVRINSVNAVVYGILAPSEQDKEVVGVPVLGTVAGPSETEPLLLNREGSMRTIDGGSGIRPNKAVL